jgi:hypothetical protein
VRVESLVDKLFSSIATSNINSSDSCRQERRISNFLEVHHQADFFLGNIDKENQEIKLFLLLNCSASK